MNLTSKDIAEAIDEAEVILKDFVACGKSRAMIDGQIAIILELQAAHRESVKSGGVLCLA